jgi:hypothetical protein
LAQWDPVIPVDFDASRVYRTINEFGQVVDSIEEGRFAPPSLKVLNEVLIGVRRERFATRVCRNCDARFSCSSYRQYAWKGRGVAERRAAEYFADPHGDVDQEEWRTANLAVTPNSNELNQDL